MKTFYAVNLNGKTRGLSRWALYYMISKGKMSVLWAENKPGANFVKDSVKNSHIMIPGMVFYPRKDGGPEKYPAFHFLVKGSEMNHLDDLADTLAQHYKEDVTLAHLHGHSPTLHTMPYEGVK